MLQAMLAGVASIKAQQTRMNVIGNNLANINTTAYKGTRVTFQDMMAQTITGATRPTETQGGMNPVQYGLGVMLAATDVNGEQGSLNATNNPADMALQGNGFFLVGNGEGYSYTRDGAFGLDANGYLVHQATGQRLLGWSADSTGAMDTSQPVSASSFLNVPIGSRSAVQATTAVNFTGNLNATADNTEAWTTSVRVFDGLGGQHDLSVKFSNRTTLTDPLPSGAPEGAVSRWDWEASEPSVGTDVIGSSATGSNQPIYFGSNGQILNAEVLGAVTVPAGGSAAAFDINLDFGSLQQVATDTQVQANSQNGYGPGSLQGFSIGTDGMITGLFTNGMTRSLGQIAVAVFANSDGLERLGNNLWRNTDNSGAPVVGTAKSGGRATIQSGYLEQSNVDIGTEFTDLIVTQRGFQANTRVVTTVDEMLQELLSMKR